MIKRKESEVKCIDICFITLKMILAAGEDYRGLCEEDTSGVYHAELERRLKNYKLVRIK